MSPIKIPSLSEVKAAGYDVKINHVRLFKVAYIDDLSKKLVVKNVLKTYGEMRNDISENILNELLPKGGKTEVILTDTETNVEFYASTTCRNDENYSKSIGINKALERVIGLMLVCDGRDGFTMRIKA